MIEIYDIQDIQEEKKPLDITPELAVMAARVLKEWCRKSDYYCVIDGERCPFYDKACTCSIRNKVIPEEWELPERKNNDGEDRKV